ncbi:unnamed protein product [Auanema sp. JU1783]|nr:unnamed protein product [Auanema sp. JU1783]
MHEDKPLVATYTTQRPPWLGLWSSREYSGRPDWWKENGEKDEVVRSGRLRLCRAKVREDDPDWWDPKVEDGKSLAGPNGLDGTKTPNVTIKGDQPGNLEDFQNKTYAASHQFKAIAEEFGLSKEHPGLAVNPTLNDLINTPKSFLGRSVFLPNSWHHFGPRFFDQPLNEASFVKGLACAKYAAIFMAPYTLLEIRATHSIPVSSFSPRNYFKRYLKLAPLPVSVAFAWGFTLSSAANLRNKDDVYNHLFASAAVGAVTATFKDSLAIGVTAAILSTILGSFWQYARVSETGLQGKVHQPQSGGIWGGPLAWKLFQHGDIAPPESKF